MTITKGKVVPDVKEFGRALRFDEAKLMFSMTEERIPVDPRKNPRSDRAKPGVIDIIDWSCHLKPGEDASFGELKNRTGLSDTTLRRRIDEALKSCLLNSEGNARNTKYYLPAAVQ